MQSETSVKLLFFVTEDWYFVSHRLALAVAARDAGYAVTVVTRVDAHGDVIRDAGLRLIPFDIDRSGVNPFKEAKTLLRLIRLWRRERPDIVHHVAMKPVLYGSIAARVARVPRQINALAGMGWLFTSRAGLARLLKPVVRRGLIFLLRSDIVLIQNPDDEALLRDAGIPQDRVRRIAGSGVDLTAFHVAPEGEGIISIVFPARLLWDKGIGEFVDAARRLKEKGVEARFLLAGDPDSSNPSAVSSAQIRAWVDEGVVEHLGWVADMPALLSRCHIVCLPSYREGLPKSLIEGAAAGRAIVTTDVPGCREVVRHGENGMLVPVRDAGALADALERLIANPEMRRRMGDSGRKRAEQEFALDVIIEQSLRLYAECAA
jgi:glycosyltransferase involved in cell wall biosynthesis